ncbi:MAG: TrbG/VirB9 family P-type conjugative transfer protein [Alphaproteobacteria bacterium]|nr:TrbG/VirB9 family P-type conjugative transfer protein [Alphaproteobacteria bacterium]
MSVSKNVNAQATMNSMDQNADQSQGNYMPMDMGYAGFNSLGMTQSAWLDPLQNLGEGQSRPAYSKYYWSPDLVLPVRLREGMLTLLNFPDWELIEDIYIGDNSTFDGQISGPNTLLLYPRKGAQVGVDTNIIVFGRSGNRYVFYAKSEGVNTERLTNSIIDIDVISEDAGGNGGGSLGGSSMGKGGGSGRAGGKGNSGKSLDSTYTKRFQKADWIKHIPLDPENMRFDIEVYIPNPDDVVIAPERVWRDDIFTYIDLGEKSLNMTQRPIVTLIVERIEVPVGFRAAGPNNRLIVVEAIGDMVLRNGKRIICLKMRKSDSQGMPTFASDLENQEWSVPAPLPDFSQNGNENGAMGSGANGMVNATGTDFVPAVGSQGAAGGRGIRYNGGAGFGNDYGNISNASAFDSTDYSKMQRISGGGQSLPQGVNGKQAGASSNMGGGYGAGFMDSGSSISIELGTDANVNNLEILWGTLSSKYSDVLSVYEPFYSVDAPADGQGKELFHLRVGPVNSLNEGDTVCGKLGRNGVFCSVVRTQ